MSLPKKKAAQTPRKERKDDHVRMRVTEQEKAAFVTAAGKKRLGLSAWLRQVALRAAGVLSERD